MQLIKFIALALITWFFSNLSTEIDKKYASPQDSVRQTTSSPRP